MEHNNYNYKPKDNELPPSLIDEKDLGRKIKKYYLSLAKIKEGNYDADYKKRSN